MANLWTTQECGLGKDWPIRCGGEIVAIAQDGETARRICAAVNCHQELVAALRIVKMTVEEHTVRGGVVTTEVVDQLALFLATGRGGRALKNAESV